MKGTWQTTGMSPGAKAGLAALVIIVIGAVAARREVVQVANDLTVIVLGVLAAGVVLVITAGVLLGRRVRREAVVTAAYRERQAEEWRVQIEERKARAAAAQQAAALPAAAPTVQVVNVIDRALLSTLTDSQPAVRVIPAPFEEER